MKADFDIAVIGSGFAGSLIAMVAKRLGHSVVMIERGRHPRFAIGESSTPLANLLLEELAQRYDLPAVRPLCKWGAWQESLPHVGCGLKRGFTFLHHAPGQPFADEMLVAASPRDAIADTHWYRPDVDLYLVKQAQEMGVEFRDQTELSVVAQDDGGFTLADQRGSEIRAGFVIDASGPRGFLHRALGLQEREFSGFPKTQALFAHFRGVEKWEALHTASEHAPYPADEAAVHHVFDGGWIWVLRFNNGLTSAGVATTEDFVPDESGWQRVIERLPAVRAQFAHAEPVTAFMHQPRVAFCTSAAAGKNWAMLPSAAGVIDPLLSTGFPLTLHGVERLARIIEDGCRSDVPLEYERQIFSELDATAALVAALYANMHDFEIFSALTLLYFAAASYSESARRLHRRHLAQLFLLCEDVRFGPALRRCCKDAMNRETPRAELLARIYAAIEPFDVAGLGHGERHPWYPALAEDLLASAHKLGATRAEAAHMLAECGFAATADKN